MTITTAKTADTVFPHRLGWRPSIPDHRDKIFKVSKQKKLAAVVDLTSMMPPVFDQGDLGSCTACAVAAAVQYERTKAGREGARELFLSRLFIYYNERVIEDTVNFDSGATIRDSIKAVNKLGACDEKEWPYDISAFATRAPAACYEHALAYACTSYSSIVQNTYDLRASLAEGHPFCFGFSVTDGLFALPRAGIYRKPASRAKILGGHAVLAVGYDMAKQLFKIRNSWGTEWGVGGYFYMPFDFVSDKRWCADFWNIKVVSK